jgi:hypothetical protein
MAAIAKSRQQGRLRHVIARFLFALPNGFGGLHISDRAHHHLALKLLNTNVIKRDSRIVIRVCDNQRRPLASC